MTRYQILGWLILFQVIATVAQVTATILHFLTKREYQKLCDEWPPPLIDPDEIAPVIMRWITTGSACDDCLNLEALGWQLIETKPFGDLLPGSPELACRKDGLECHCRIEVK